MNMKSRHFQIKENRKFIANRSTTKKKKAKGIFLGWWYMTIDRNKVVQERMIISIGNG